MNTLPEFALSVRQPWAWAIIYGGKDIENRNWTGGPNHGLKRRGRFAIHASKTLGREEYEEARDFINSLGVACPPAIELQRGGLIGTVEIVDNVRQSTSPWFFGPDGLVLRDPQPVDFKPVVGQLGFFKWEEADASFIPSPTRWMREPQLFRRSEEESP